MSNFEKELKELINKHSLEEETDTPDFLLADYLAKCLETFNYIVLERDRIRNKDINEKFD